MAEGLLLTVMGMGTVFCSLILLTLFTSGFNLLFAGKTIPAGTAITETPMSQTSSPTTTPMIPTTTKSEQTTSAAISPVQPEQQNIQLTEKRRRAAIIAVALLLATGARQPEIFHPRETEGVNWRLGYRQQFIHGGGRRR